MNRHDLRPAPAPRAAIEAHQQRLVRDLLAHLLERNPFYVKKLSGLIRSNREFTLGELANLPFTTKNDLVADQEAFPPFGSIHGDEPRQYVRLHRTSGTSGKPLLWLDTKESWSSFLDSWQRVLFACGVVPGDRVYVAFSFGPFIGFWGAFEAAQRLGAMALSGGGTPTDLRLQHILDLEATVVICTPTYALHLAEHAHRRGVDLAAGSVTKLIAAGEPGANVPAVKARIERQWGAVCHDHAGATELGAWGYPGQGGKLYVDEDSFVAEVVDPQSGLPLPGGVGRGELVMTSLRRLGSPLLRYRTGDLVELRRGGNEPKAVDPPGLVDGRSYIQGGILGRCDDMFVVRGVNVYPSAIEDILRGFPDLAEFRATVRRSPGLAALEIEVEPATGFTNTTEGSLAIRAQTALHRALQLKIAVSEVAPGTLPRFELKAKRFLFV